MLRGSDCGVTSDRAIRRLGDKLIGDLLRGGQSALRPVVGRDVMPAAATLAEV